MIVSLGLVLGGLASVAAVTAYLLFLKPGAKEIVLTLLPSVILGPIVCAALFGYAGLVGVAAGLLAIALFTFWWTTVSQLNKWEEAGEPGKAPQLERMAIVGQTLVTAVLGIAFIVSNWFFRSLSLAILILPFMLLTVAYTKMAIRTPSAVRWVTGCRIASVQRGNSEVADDDRTWMQRLLATLLGVRSDEQIPPPTR